MTYKLMDLIVRVLREKGPLTVAEIANILGVNFKAINKSIGAAKKRGLVESDVPVIKTPYGSYTPKNSVGRWRLKEEVNP